MSKTPLTSSVSKVTLSRHSLISTWLKSFVKSNDIIAFMINIYTHNDTYPDL